AGLPRFFTAVGSIRRLLNQRNGLLSSFICEYREDAVAGLVRGNRCGLNPSPVRISIEIVARHDGFIHSRKVDARRSACVCRLARCHGRQGGDDRDEEEFAHGHKLTFPAPGDEGSDLSSCQYTLWLRILILSTVGVVLPQLAPNAFPPAFHILAIELPTAGALFRHQVSIGPLIQYFLTRFFAICIEPGLYATNI